MVKRRAEDDAKEAAAATKIQATFRGFKARQELKDVDQAAAKIQAGFRGYKVRKEMKNGRSRRSSNPEQGEAPQRIQHSGSVEESAATKIQAGVRGFLVRRKYQKEQDAATKIQAGFRGYHSRKQVTN
ncbi:hypothetical protein J6590_015964 [Homalodisca vitripennis]|nr:hypothetical protein J6590_015964 [Homalodisca vitripennis]